MPWQFPIFQLPNRPLIAAMLAGAIGRTAGGPVSRSATLLSRLAVLLWSAEEMATGVSWFRRLLGIVGGVYAFAGLKRQVRQGPAASMVGGEASRSSVAVVRTIAYRFRLMRAARSTRRTPES